MGVNLNEKGEQGHIMIYWTPIGCNRFNSIKHDLIQSAIFIKEWCALKLRDPYWRHPITMLLLYRDQENNTTTNNDIDA